MLGDEDEGCTQGTVRHDARVWTLTFECLTAKSTRATSSHHDRLAEQLRTCFQNMAAAGQTITYGGLARLLELSPPNTIRQITVGLERLMEEDAEAGRPFIAALVVSKARGGLPAMGFFDCARRLGRFAGDPNGVEARSFHAAELNAALKFWGGW
jgi:hypothetical protein